MDVRKIKTAPGLEFDCSLAGSPDGVPVLLLHGFGVSRHFWDRRVPALADAGYFAIAPTSEAIRPALVPIRRISTPIIGFLSHRARHPTVPREGPATGPATSSPSHRRSAG
jgi:hypothetical protein